jgi:glutamate--cysteine ligase
VTLSATSGLSGRLTTVENVVRNAADRVEQWFGMQWQKSRPPFYTSVDMRNSGHKVAPVDTNLFPGGFNNLPIESLHVAITAAAGAVERHCAQGCRVLLVPENHTRNKFYLRNIARLKDILERSGLDVRLGILTPEITGPTELDAGDGQFITVERLLRDGDHVSLPDFRPCTVVLNNDLSAGLPEILQNLSPEQNLVPPLHAGWAVRRKSNHCASYDRAAGDFARFIDIDPWLVNTYSARVAGVNFHRREGEQQLADAVADVLGRVRSKYAEYAITEQPFVIVKADAGTYGMSVMKVTEPADVIGLNSRARNKMSVIKDGMRVSELLIQEGVPTIEEVDGGTAERVIYLIDRHVVGGFYRVNAARGRNDNLNASGMTFKPLPTAAGADTESNRFYTYGVISRLAALAAARELDTADAHRVTPCAAVTV